MSRSKEIRRQLDGVWQVIETLDADLATGRIGEDEHARERAEREREAGRLFVALRRSQREAGETSAPPRRAAPPDEDDTEAPAGDPFHRRVPVLVTASVVLLVAGIAGGVVIGRRNAGGPGAPTTTAAVPADAPGVGTTESELRALREAAAQPDAPVPSLLQFAHVLLDQGRADEARKVYDRVLAREPRNPEAITHLGAVLFQQGKADEALARVDEALGIDPKYLHALWDKTEYLFQRRDFAGAIKAAEAFLAVAPGGPDAEHMRKLIAQAKQESGPR